MIESSEINQTYDLTHTEMILRDELNTTCNDTTNDDDEFVLVSHSQNSEKKSK